jgi:hypothetical protein
VPNGVELTAGQEMLEREVESKPKTLQVINSELNKLIVKKKIVKTIVFYADFTFDVFQPNEQ